MNLHRSRQCPQRYGPVVLLFIALTSHVYTYCLGISINGIVILISFMLMAFLLAVCIVSSVVVVIANHYIYGLNFHLKQLCRPHPGFTFTCFFFSGVWRNSSNSKNAKILQFTLLYTIVCLHLVFYCTPRTSLLGNGATTPATVTFCDLRKLSNV